MRGRKPKPTILKLLAGNPGHQRLNHQEPRPGRLATDVPAVLAGNAEATAEWARVIVPAIHLGQIAVTDFALAVGHCVQWACWRSQLDDAGRHAHVIGVGRDKYPRPNVARQMANQSLALLIRIDAELGLTPASRSRVTATSNDRTAEDDALDAILDIS